MLLSRTMLWGTRLLSLLIFTVIHDLASAELRSTHGKQEPRERRYPTPGFGTLELFAADMSCALHE